jgi:hypothetical protein
MVSRGKTVEVYVVGVRVGAYIVGSLVAVCVVEVMVEL